MSSVLRIAEMVMRFLRTTAILRRNLFALVLFSFLILFLIHKWSNSELVANELHFGLENVLGGQLTSAKNHKTYLLESSMALLQRSGNKVFFIETSFSPSLNYRQACSVESIALSNPELTINVLMTAATIDFGRTSMSVLQNYSNINIISIVPADFFIGTPLEHWYFRTDWITGPFTVEHLADALRYITLYKYGGYYFDLDVIVMRSLADLRNFAASEGPAVNIAAMHFDYNHPVIVALVEEFRISYNKSLWGHARPGAITRVLEKYCQVENFNDAIINGVKPCQNFTIYPKESFYPIYGTVLNQFFDNDTSSAMEKWDKTKVFGVHIWNKLSAGLPAHKNFKQLYSELARMYCPKTFSAAPDPF